MTLLAIESFLYSIATGMGTVGPGLGPTDLKSGPNGLLVNIRYF